MAPDLRAHPCDDIMNRVEKALQTTFDPTTEVRKRRSLGLRTAHNTWVRIEVKDIARIDGQGWGVECAAVLEGVNKPVWFQGFSWLDTDLRVTWRADETEYVTDASIKPGGILTTDPALPIPWWETFNASLSALAGHTTTRVATPGLHPITQTRITETIDELFPEVDTVIDEWASAHGDLAWSNLTTPACYLLDWEDWVMAPRGFDAATLWSESLAVSGLAERVYAERQADLDSRSGRLARLFHCAELLTSGPDYAGPLFGPAKAAAAELVNTLR